MISLAGLKRQFSRLRQNAGHGEPVVYVTRKGGRTIARLKGQNVSGDLNIQMVNGDVQVEGATVVYDLSPEGMDKRSTELWQSLPLELRERMVAIILTKMQPPAVEHVRQLHAADPLSWSTEYHHGAGTNVRNVLREGGVTDDKLRAYYPDDWNGYWGLDDFWVAAIEAAAGVRET